MRDRRELVRSKVGGGVVRTGRAQRPVLDRDHVHDGHVVDRIGVANRSPVDPHRRSVVEPDVASTVRRRRARRNGHVEGEPRRTVGIAVIDAVGPHEMVELLEIEGEGGAELVRSCLGHQHRLAFEGGRQLDDESFPGVMGGTQECERMRRIGQRGGIDDDAFARRPTAAGRFRPAR